MRSSVSVLAPFICSLPAMNVSSQIPEKATAATLPALSVTLVETVVKWKKMGF